MGTKSEYDEFCSQRTKFSRHLALYIEEHINIQAYNRILVALVALAPWVFNALFLGFWALKLLTPTIAVVLLCFFTVYLVCSFFAVMFICRKISRVVNEGLDLLRKTEAERVALLREFAKKEYPQEQK